MGFLDNAKNALKQAEKYGDVNKDGKVDSKDLDKVKPYADLNKDGKLNSEDFKAAEAKLHKK